jgi:hypothetical protein
MFAAKRAALLIEDLFVTEMHLRALFSLTFTVVDGVWCDSNANRRRVREPPSLFDASRVRMRPRRQKIKNHPSKNVRSPFLPVCFGHHSSLESGIADTPLPGLRHNTGSSSALGLLLAVCEGLVNSPFKHHNSSHMVEALGWFVVRASLSRTPNANAMYRSCHSRDALVWILKTSRVSALKGVFKLSQPNGLNDTMDAFTCTVAYVRRREANIPVVEPEQTPQCPVTCLKSRELQSLLGSLLDTVHNNSLLHTD